MLSYLLTLKAKPFLRLISYLKTSFVNWSMVRMLIKLLKSPPPRRCPSCWRQNHALPHGGKNAALKKTVTR